MPVHNYLKARFASASAAAQAVPRLAALIRQGQQAHAFWQAHRQLEQQGRRTEFWTRLQTAVPEILRYLGPLAGGDCDTGLLGFLEFGKADGIELYAEGPYVCLKAVDLWCGADWDPLVTYLRTQCGASNAHWIGDEPVDYFGLLDP